MKPTKNPPILHWNQVGPLVTAIIIYNHKSKVCGTEQKQVVLLKSKLLF